MLAKEFDKAFDMILRYIQTADLRGEELSWKNYRQKYLRHTRKARSLLRSILRRCRKVGSIQLAARALSTPLAVISDVETETEEKLRAANTFKRHWKEFLEALEVEVRRAYDVFPNRDFDVDERLCFVLMPFDRKMARVYKESIMPSVKETGMKCKLAKDMSRSTPIMQDVWEFINRARIVIADLTGNNPNVLYELGLSHALSKRAIIVSQTPRKVPFDVRHIRYIEYKDSSNGRSILRGSLRTTLRNMLRL